MLVLSRLKDESVVIGSEETTGSEIRVTIVDIRGDKVRLGFSAPSHIPVHREEIWIQIQQQNASDPNPERPVT